MAQPKINAIFPRIHHRIASYHTLFLLVFIITAHPVIAQDDVADSVRYKAIVIAAERTGHIPAAQLELGQQTINDLQLTVSLKEALRSVPGVFVNNRYNFSLGDRISIRGLGSRAQYGNRSIKILLDGIPLTFADGTTQLNNLDPGWVGSMTITRGPGATMYGNAAGGVINIQSAIPDTPGLYFTPRYTMGSFGLHKMQGSLSGKLKRTGFLISSTATSYGGFREFSEARLYNVNSVIQHRFNGRTRMDVIFNWTEAPYMLNPGSLMKEDALQRPEYVRPFVKSQGAGKSVSQGQGGVTLKHRFGKGYQWSSTIYGVQRDLFNPIVGRIIDLKRQSAGTRNTIYKTYRLGMTRLRLSTGMDLEYQVDRRREFENDGLDPGQVDALPPAELLNEAGTGSLQLDQEEMITNGGMFISGLWSLRIPLTLKAGMRYDQFNFKIRDHKDAGQVNRRYTFSQWSPSAGVRYSFRRLFSLFINYATAFQTPTANEFSNDPAGRGFNEDLRPERIYSLESGIEKKWGSLQAQLVGFHMTVHDQLIPYQLPGPDEITYYRNAGKTRNTGTELWIQYQVTNPALKLTMSYTYMNYRFRNYEVQNGDVLTQLKGNEVPGVPAHQLFTGLRYDLADFTAEINYRWTSAYFANDHNGPLPGEQGKEGLYVNDPYTLLDLRFGYRIDAGFAMVRCFAGINNVLDSRYNGSVVPNAFGNRYFEPAPGRNYYLGLEVPLVLKKDGRITGKI